LDAVLLLQQLINGLSKGSVYALIALGYTMVYGIIELINFAHGDVFMLGAFTALSFASVLGANGQNPALKDPIAVIIVLLLTFLVTMVLMGGLGVLIERFAYRPLRNAPRLAPLISAIGVSYILQNIGLIWKGPSIVTFPAIFADTVYKIPVGDRFILIRSKAILIVTISVVLMVFLTQFVSRTKLGKAMRATAQDRSTAQLMGINVNLTIALTFFIGGALAGAGAVLYGMYIQAVQFTL